MPMILVLLKHVNNSADDSEIHSTTVRNVFSYLVQSEKLHTFSQFKKNVIFLADLAARLMELNILS